MLSNLKSQISNWAALAAALALCAVLHPALVKAGRYQPACAMTDRDREAANTSSFALILGEVRASTADLLWIKTERYLHRGVAYKPHLDEDAMARTGELSTVHDDPSGRSGLRPDESAHSADLHDDHEPLVSLVPDREHDYRGFIGTLQRAVQPWKGPDEPDEHTAGDELVPWYRLLTYSDPHHWRGYLIGTWWLSKIKDSNALDEAESFIDEGIKNNPEAFQLHLMRGRLRIQRALWGEAVACFERAVQAGLKVRPDGGTITPPVWSESDEEDFAAALRYIPTLQLHKLNQPQAARDSLRRALALIPRDGPLRGLQAQLP